MWSLQITLEHVETIDPPKPDMFLDKIHVELCSLPLDFAVLLCLQRWFFVKGPMRWFCPPPSYRSLEEQLDTAVDHEVNIKLSRAGEVMNIHLRVVDFHTLLLASTAMRLILTWLMFDDFMSSHWNNRNALRSLYFSCRPWSISIDHPPQDLSRLRGMWRRRLPRLVLPYLQDLQHSHPGPLLGRVKSSVQKPLLKRENWKQFELKHFESPMCLSIIGVSVFCDSW